MVAAVPVVALAVTVLAEVLVIPIVAVSDGEGSGSGSEGGGEGEEDGGGLHVDERRVRFLRFYCCLLAMLEHRSDSIAARARA